MKYTIDIFYNKSRATQDGAMSTNISGLCNVSENCSLKNQAINDKWIVEALNECLRKHGGRVSGKKANLVERFVFC